MNYQPMRFEQKESNPVNLGVTSMCICGSNWFNAQICFNDEYEIAAYLLQAFCVNCNAEVVLPTPADLT